MVKEYGLCTNGDILIEEDNQTFVDLMEKDLPKDRIIKIKLKDSRFIWNVEENYWDITPGMIEEESKMKYPQYFV